MRDDLFRKVLAKTALAILTDDSDNIIWETDKSPVSGMYRAYFKNKFSESKDMILYASQAGIANYGRTDTNQRMPCGKSV